MSSAPHSPGESFSLSHARPERDDQEHGAAPVPSLSAPGTSVLFQVSYCWCWVVGEGTEANTPRNPRHECQRCSESVRESRWVSCAPNYSQNLLRQLQGLHSLIPLFRTPSPKKKKKKPIKAEDNLGQTPRMSGWPRGTLAAASAAVLGISTSPTPQPHCGVRRGLCCEPDHPRGPTWTAALDLRPLMSVHQRWRCRSMLTGRVEHSCPG